MPNAHCPPTAHTSPPCRPLLLSWSVQMWSQYTPCACEGPCNQDCPCAGDANFCEKFCGCNPALCGNRFAGCQCQCGKSGR